MTESARCSSCGAELSQDSAPQGLCPACLLKLGLSSTNIPADEPAQPSVSPPPKGNRASVRKSVIGLIIAAVVLFGLLQMFFLVRGRLSSPPPLGVFRFSLPLRDPIDF